MELSRPPKSFRWLKGSQELQSDDKYELIQEEHTYVLLIRSAVYEDEAKYMFEAEDKRTSCKLILQGPNNQIQMKFVMCTVSLFPDHPERLVGFQNLICLTFLVAGIRLEFVKPIKDVTVKERETAEFSVELSHENISVVWYKNDIRLHPSKVVHMSDHGKIHTLAFKEVSIDDTSMIKVEAMDKTVTAMLTVIGQQLQTSKRDFMLVV